MRQLHETINCTLGWNVRGSHVRHKDTGHSSTQGKEQMGEMSWGGGVDGRKEFEG